MQECETRLEHLNGMKRVKETFKRASKRVGIGGCLPQNRVIHELAQIAVSAEELSWI